MKHLIIIFFLSASNIFAADIRTDFHKGMFSEDELENIANSEVYDNSVLTVAYKGVCYTMLADYQFLPTSKLSYFNDGKSYLERAIKNSPKNTELRYLRLLVQLNCPGFLGYDDKVNEDLNFFNNHIASYKIEDKWKKIFVINLLAGENLTDNQKNKLLALQKQYG